MFGPNHTPEIHHRELDFEELYSKTKDLFYRKFKIDPKVWDIFFITGSGTCAIETMVTSVKGKIVVATMGHFSTRASNLLHHTDKRWPGMRGNNTYVVAYETAESKYYGNEKIEWVDEFGNVIPIQVILADCISSFPYYKPIGDIWATVTSKQLGCAPGLSIIVMKKELWYTDKMEPANGSYMSLAKYKIKDNLNQTPHTPAISLIQDLYNKLDTFNLDNHRRMIDNRRKKILSLLPHEFVIGEGPVVTIKNNNLKTQQLVEKMSLYNHSSDGPQIFLWSGTDAQYEKLYKELERIFN